MDLVDLIDLLFHVFRRTEAKARLRARLAFPFCLPKIRKKITPVLQAI